MNVLLPLLPILVGIARANPQYPPAGTVCEQGLVCVDSYLCEDGVINPEAGLDLRNSICAAQEVCCKPPYVPPPTPTYEPCPPTHGCVNKHLCVHGEIDTSGAGGFDLRIGGPSTGLQACLDATTKSEGVCCKKDIPSVTYCPAYHKCVKKGTCGATTPPGGYDTTNQEQLCKLSSDPYNPEIGVCCEETTTTVTCDQDEKCIEENQCSFDGYNPTAPKKCEIYGIRTHGVCCKAELPPCKAGSSCTPYSYCTEQGYLSKTELTGAIYKDGAKCTLGYNTGVCCNPPPVGCPNVKDACVPAGSCPHLDTGSYSTGGSTCSYLDAYNGQVEGVCCPPPPPKTKKCGVEHICTPKELCKADGTISYQPVTNPYGLGDECHLDGVSNNNLGVCCKIYVPRVDVECPYDAVCVRDLNMCNTQLLESTESGSYSDYSPTKEYVTCSTKEIHAGYCCKFDNKCGVNPLATNDYYQTPLGNEEASFGEFPWQAIVFDSATNNYACGGVLISESHVLTVGHCVFKKAAHGFKVRLGEWNVLNFSEPNAYEDYSVKNVILHPEYNPKKQHNNIAILELNHILKFSPHINRICIAKDEYQFPYGKRCVVAGWGKDTFTGNHAVIMKKVSVPLVERNECQERLRTTRLTEYFQLHKSYLCAGGEPGIDACTGDGGSALACLDEATQQWHALGLVAWGVGCGQPIPSAYTSIPSVLPWLQSVIDGNTGGVVY